MSNIQSQPTAANPDEDLGCISEEASSSKKHVTFQEQGKDTQPEVKPQDFGKQDASLSPSCQEKPSVDSEVQSDVKDPQNGFTIEACDDLPKAR